jgi:acyl dehydratase
MTEPLLPAFGAGLQTEFTPDVVLGYAEAAADFNSIHLSDKAARELGFSGAIAHGMLTLGWAVQRLLERRESAPLTAVDARFGAPVPVGARVHLKIEDIAADPLSARVLLDDGTVALTVRTSVGPVPPDAVLAPDAELVAERTLQVDQEAALRFAHAVSAGVGIYTSVLAAEHAGFPAMPMVPTIAFALAELGFLPDDPANSGVPAPDSVADCQDWAQTTRPVVHAGQSFVFHRPILVGERVLARTAITERTSRRNASGTALRFTKVRTVFESAEGTPISTSDMNLVVIGD